MLYELQLAFRRDGLCLDGSLYGSQLGVERTPGGEYHLGYGLQFGLLVGIHLVDGSRELLNGLLVLERPLVDGLHHLGEVVYYRHLYLIVYLGSVLLA